MTDDIEGNLTISPIMTKYTPRNFIVLKNLRILRQEAPKYKENMTFDTRLSKKLNPNPKMKSEIAKTSRMSHALLAHCFIL